MFPPSIPRRLLQHFCRGQSEGAGAFLLHDEGHPHWCVLPVVCSLVILVRSIDYLVTRDQVVAETLGLDSAVYYHVDSVDAGVKKIQAAIELGRAGRI